MGEKTRKAPIPGAEANAWKVIAIDFANVEVGQTINHKGDVMAYLSKGSGTANGEAIAARQILTQPGGKDIIGNDVCAKLKNDLRVRSARPARENGSRSVSREANRLSALKYR